MDSAEVENNGFQRTAASGAAGATPFSSVQVCIPKEQLIRLRAELQYWQTQHARAVQREAAHKQKIEELRARVRYLEGQVYGRKSERGGGGHDQRRSDCTTSPPRPRGQQPGQPGHGRTRLEDLPVHDELVDLADTDKRCPQCGAPLQPFPGTEDSEVVEIEVRPYRRRLRRQRYRPSCCCGTLPGMVTAPAPNRLIDKGKLGISVWVTILLDKFLSARPTYRLLEDLKNHGLTLAPGTVTGGLRRLAPLFAPIEAAIRDKQREDAHWHADETTWRVFEEIDGKIGYRWYMWVFRSSSAVLFRLDPSRSAAVPAAHFQAVSGGIVVCDRYAAYQKMVRDGDGSIVLAFCWAHVRRDFLTLAKTQPAHEAWAMAWVERIAELYRLNHQRLAVNGQPERFAACDASLRAALRGMAETRDSELQQPALPPARRKPLKSLKRHWRGLIRFADNPEIPMDNNSAERSLRGPVLGRKNFYGSGSTWSGRLAATMFSLLQTVQLSQINPRHWLSAYLHACAAAGNRPPRELAPFLPWLMDEAQRKALGAPPDS